MNALPASHEQYNRGRRTVTILVAMALAAGLTGCASRPSVSVTQPLAAGADAPYDEILVVALFSSFDARRYLEQELVERLEARGLRAVRATSMMNSRTPVAAQTFIDMVRRLGTDSVLVTQLTAYQASASEEDMRPESTWNYHPTYYYNVFEVELTEYIEPPRISIEHTIVLATQMFSVEAREPVWGMDSRSEFVEIQEEGLDYRVYEWEADAIVSRLARDGVIAGR